MLAQKLDELEAGDEPLSRRQHQDAARDERQHDLEHRRVEAWRRELQHAVGWCEAERRSLRAHEVRQPAVRELRALRAARRARRVNHVRERVARRIVREVVGTFLLDGLALKIQIHDARLVRWQ